MKRRSLKDLPFGGLKIGDVLYKGGRGTRGNYTVSGKTSFYENGGSSSGGLKVFEDSEENILDMIWDNSEWFEVADVKHMDVVATTTNITLKFKPIDIEDSETIAKGIIHVMKHLEEKSYSWNEFCGFTMKMSSR